MSYDIDTPLQKIIEGIKEFNDAAKRRMCSEQYNRAHVIELKSWRKKLTALSIDLEELVKD